MLLGVENREYIAESLIRCGRSASQPAAFIENGTTARKRVVEATLAAVASGRVEAASPAIFVIGDVVRLRSRLAPSASEPRASASVSAFHLPAGERCA